MSPITHAKVSTKADSPDTSLVRPSDWNEDHAGSAETLRETSGPTDLPIGAIAAGEFLRRVGATIVGAAAGGVPVWIPASDAWVGIQGGATKGSITDGDDEGMPVWLFDDTATESVGTSFLATQTGNLTITIYYSMAGGNVAKSVRFRFAYLAIADGEDAGALGVSFEETRAVPNNADEQDILQLSTVVAVVEDDLVRLTVIRLPAHGDDDAVGDMQLHGIKVEY